VIVVDETSKESLEKGVSLATVHVSVRRLRQSPPGSVNSVEFVKFLLSTITLMLGWNMVSPRTVKRAARQSATVDSSTETRHAIDLPDAHGQKSSV
jgi:hypothetical protein